MIYELSSSQVICIDANVKNNNECYNSGATGGWSQRMEGYRMRVV